MSRVRGRATTAAISQAVKASVGKNWATPEEIRIRLDRRGIPIGTEAVRCHLRDLASDGQIETGHESRQRVIVRADRRIKQAYHVAVFRKAN